MLYPVLSEFFWWTNMDSNHRPFSLRINHSRHDNYNVDHKSSMLNLIHATLHSYTE